ncbi:MAG: hypothetical protein KC656_35210, partial [Myxococcales bacterium]|nr:hypothetical protein [Myxococcales bacterium]
LLAAACTAETPILPVPAGTLDVDWTPQGPELPSDAGDLALAPARWGRPGALEPLVLAAPSRRGERVVYGSDAVDAWYVERPDGLQQGFDVRERPPGSGPLELRVGLAGSPAPADDALYWVDEDLRIHARYAGLSAWDATGRALRVDLGLVCEEGCEAVLRVDDAGAEYPLVVDPLLSTQHTTDDLPTSLELVTTTGSAMDLDGDWLGLWSPDDHEVLLYERHGAVWEQDQWVEDTDFGDDVPWRFGRSLSIDGDRLAVGGVDAVYLYEDVGGVWSPRTFVEKPDDGLVDATTVSTFGAQVQLSGDTLAVGVTGLDLVYVFDRDGATDTWSLAQTIQGTTGFGKGVVLDGDRMLV